MVLGITGISGSGKHTAAQFFKKKGWVVLDADKMAHNAYRPYTSVWKSIVKEFGEKILTQNDTIDRQKLGKIVFNASEPEAAQAALSKLNELVHPYLIRKIKDKMHRHFRRKSNIVVVAALWQEVGFKQYCDHILLVQARPALCQERIQHRDGISGETYQMRIKNQSEPFNSNIKKFISFKFYYYSHSFVSRFDLSRIFDFCV